MWLLTAINHKPVICPTSEDAFAYMKLHSDLSWTIQGVLLWQQEEPKPKSEKYERPFKPMSQE